MTADDGVVDAGPDARDGHDVLPAAAEWARVATSTDDDRDAVRARLMPSSSSGGEPHMRVARPRSPSVSVQRHPVVDGTPRDAAIRAVGGERYVLRDGTETLHVILGEPYSTADGAIREVIVDGFRFEVETVSDSRSALRERATRAGAAAATSGPLEVRAVIPGKVLRVAVAVGDDVSAGQQLLVVEAMKMQNELRAPRDGTITAVGAATGANIEVGDVLVVIS